VTDAATAARLAAALSGRYTLERELGEGGMATVYLAHDVKHDRRVAIKVLRPELAAIVGAERFLAEIRTTANLHHPHILPLFDSGEADSFLYYVMPYVQGESLRHRLDREKQLPVADAVHIAKAVAGALDHAHRQGVIHRDIKPANILLQDGEPVVSDFGIALAVSAAGGGRLTETGLSLGTPYYMSPEQAAADRDPGPASDVYSLACVIYELIAGDPPYTGSTAQAVLARILTDRARPLTELRETVPSNVAAAVARALAKVPADRFESAAAFAAAIDDPGFTHVPARPSEGTSPGPALGQRTSRWQLSAVAGITGLLGFVLGALLERPAPEASSEPIRFVLTADSGFNLSTVCCSASEVVSPDGRMIAHMGNLDGARSQIFLRPLRELTSSPVRGSEGGRAPAFSPEGDWIAFNGENNLMRVPVEGGQPMTVASNLSRAIRGISWREDNTIFFGLDGSGESVYRVPADGGRPPELFAAPDSAAGEQAVRYPHAIPGTDAVLVTVILFEEEIPRLDVIDGGGRRSPLLRGGSAWTTDDGHIVYALPDGSIMAQRFDRERLDTIGGPFRIAEGVIYRDRRGLAEFGISRNGTMVQVAGDEEGVQTLELYPVDGGPAEPLTVEGAIRFPRFSPEGRYLAVDFAEDASTPDRDIWVYDRPQRNFSRVTVEGGVGPAWSHDGTHVFFRRMTGYGDGIRRRRWDGSAPAELVSDVSVALGLEESRDGRWMVWTAVANGQVDVWVRDNQGAGEARALLAEAYTESAPTISPDGAWIAYVSMVSGTPEVYVRSFPELGPVSKISVGGGQEPRWWPNGTGLLYRTVPEDGEGVQTVERVDLQTLEGRLEVTGRRTVLTLDPSMGRNIMAADWDVAPDGSVFAFVRLPELRRQNAYQVTLNATARDGGGAR